MEEEEDLQKRRTLVTPTLPTCSVLAWIKALAEARGLPWAQDATGNLVVRRPGSGGGEKAAPVCVQGHVDMVTEKRPDVAHDFDADPILLRRAPDGSPWLTAAGTTLGADNGVGVAAALALLDAPSTTKLPPLECLFTTDEERGLTGASGLDAAALGLTARRCLNLDTEAWGDIYIGCAGGGDAVVTLPVTRAAMDGTAIVLSVSGLKGGHSGLEIDAGLGCALRLVGRLADATAAAAPGLRVAAAAGGGKRNAIPRDAAILALVPHADAAAALAAAEAEAAGMAAEYAETDGGLAAVAAVVGAPGAPAPPPPSPAAASHHPLTKASTDALLTLLTALPHGVVKMSGAVAGLVETSSNLASIKPDAAADAFLITTSTRSSHGPALEAVRRGIARLASAVGGTTKADAAYPGWVPAPSTPLVRLVADVLEAAVGKAPAVGAIHAGLECGILKERMGGGDWVSFGPTITGAHTPEEAVDVSTVGPFYDAVLAVLGRLADE